MGMRAGLVAGVAATVISGATARLWAQTTDTPTVQGEGAVTARWPTTYPGGEASPLGARIAALLRDPRVAGAHWGIAVTDLAGTPLYGSDEAKRFRPASTAKLFTTVAAMALLGPDSTAQTVVSFAAPDADGTVAGDLTIAGGDDANLGAMDVPWRRPGSPARGVGNADLQELAEAVAAKGVRHITGRVVASAGFWDPYPEGWEIEDESESYGAPVSRLSLADNTVQVTVTAGTAAEQPAVVTATPPGSYFQIASTVRTVGNASQPPKVEVHRVPGEPALRVEGTIAAGRSASVQVTVADPPAFAAGALRQALQAAGIVVDGGVEAPHPDPPRVNFLHEARMPIAAGGRGAGEPFVVGAEPLRVVHASPPLAADVVATLKESLNLHAELMLQRLATFAGRADPFLERVEGARVVHQQLMRAGLAEHDVVLYDGSGLSVKDLVTPRAEAQLFAYAATQPWFAQWKAALPVGGVDGTLAGRFTETFLRGKVLAKTGTLGESRALAGFLRCASGREVIFAILDDNHEPGSAADREVMDQIVAAIAALD